MTKVRELYKTIFLCCGKKINKLDSLEPYFTSFLNIVTQTLFAYILYSSIIILIILRAQPSEGPWDALLPSSAKQSKASASAEISLILDSTHPPNHPGKYQNLKS